MKKLLLGSMLLLPTYSFAMSAKPELPVCDAPQLESNVAVKKQLSSADGFFQDEQGRKVILRAVNTSGDSKVPPFTPLMEKSMLEPLPAMGINSLRLLFTWEAFEPTRCNYNENYMQYFEQVVQWAAELGLYIVVDFHQDAYSRFSISGCGEGFPAWSVTRHVEKKVSDNGEKCEDWGTKMILDHTHHTTWKYFHNDDEGAKTRFLAMQNYVANRMKKYPNVIGYDLLNEPWGTDAELATLWQQSGDAIRMQDPHAILFIPAEAKTPSGLFPDNNPKPKFENISYAPHYYQFGITMATKWCGKDTSGDLNRFAAKATEWNVPLFLGEFGVSPKVSNGMDYLNGMYRWFDKGFHSYAQWNYTPTWRDDTKDGWNAEDYSITDSSGRIRENFRVRPSPVAIAGKPVYFAEDGESMEIIWEHEPQQGVTEFFLPVNFVNGKTVTISGDGRCELNGQIAKCSSSTKDTISVKIKP